MTLFRSSRPVTIIPPRAVLSQGGFDPVAAIRRLIERELYEFEAELGVPVEIRNAVEPGSPSFLIGPFSANPVFTELNIPPADAPQVHFDQERKILVADGPDLGAVAESLSLLRTLTSTGATRVTASDCTTLEAAIERIIHEVRVTYPAFHLRGIDWDAICERNVPIVRSADDPFEALQCWIAELADMHTSTRHDPPDGLLPYQLHVSQTKAVFTRVPEWTTAYKAGVRPGDRLVNVDTEAALSRNGAPQHMHPYLAGRRLLSGPVDTAQKFSVMTSVGSALLFVDTPTFQPWKEPIGWSMLPTGTGYIRLHGFPPGITERVDAVLNELGACERLIVDLRGNSGGLLVEALDIRDRFLDRPRTMGTVRYTRPDGTLSKHFDIAATPAESASGWHKPVRFLTDPMTASAAEDLLLGLQQIDGINFVGTRTGGGSGRPRTIRLLPGIRMSVSTALTYDHRGQCIEGNGIEPDLELPVSLDESELIKKADRTW
jgi:carboxyl-terminal processing protease